MVEAMVCIRRILFPRKPRLLDNLTVIRLKATAFVFIPPSSRLLEIYLVKAKGNKRKGDHVVEGSNAPQVRDI